MDITKEQIEKMATEYAKQFDYAEDSSPFLDYIAGFEKALSLFAVRCSASHKNSNKMNEQILERLRKEFAFVDDEKISGHTAMKIINDVVEELTIPKEVEQAQKYIAECHRDIGFMGSPEYDRQKKIVDAYFEPIKQKQKDEEEKANYLRLKSKYEGS